MEIRRLTSTTCLNGSLDWPDIGPVFERERIREVRGRAAVEVVYGLTSLRRDQAGAGRLLDLVRSHWGIENKLHSVRDETLGEDRCRVRTGSGPQVLAVIRNAVVHLLEGAGGVSKAAATRRFAAHPEETLPLLDS